MAPVGDAAGRWVSRPIGYRPNQPAVAALPAKGRERRSAQRGQRSLGSGGEHGVGSGRPGRSLQLYKPRSRYIPSPFRHGAARSRARCHRPRAPGGRHPCQCGSIAPGCAV